jgi:hypothetical protein
MCLRRAAEKYITGAALDRAALTLSPVTVRCCKFFMQLVAEGVEHHFSYITTRNLRHVQ